MPHAPHTGKGDTHKKGKDFVGKEDGGDWGCANWFVGSSPGFDLDAAEDLICLDAAEERRRISYRP